MKNILCPTDFSEAAYHVTAYAAKFARATGSELTLLNVQSIFELTPAEVVIGKSLTQAAARERLENLSREVRQTFRVACYADVQPAASSLARVIAEKAGEHDLIIMGTSHQDDLYHFLMGSNAYRVIRNTSLPLLAIPPGYMYGEINRMVCAYNYLEKRELPLDQLSRCAKALNCEVTVLDVMEEAYSVEAYKDLEALQWRIKKFYENKITLRFDAIRASDIAGSIDSYIRRNEADALALFAQHHNFMSKLFHKSVLKELTERADYPVFVFHH